MKTILLGLITVLVNLSAFECSAQKSSRLPAVMPETVEMQFNDSGGMIYAFTKIKIADRTINVEEKNGNEQKPRKWSAKLDEGEQENIYKLFVENSFDAIKNDERKGIVYDAGSETVSINAGTNLSFGISYGPNSPMSGDNLKRYQKIANAIKNLRAKYEGKAQNNSELDSAVFAFDSKAHYWLFKNAKESNLTGDEITELGSIIKKAVDEHNSKQNVNQKIADLDGYKFQFVPVTDENGNKVVWANAFCRDFGGDFDWKKQLVQVEDGGRCFFNLYINLTKNSYDRFSVNGEA